MTLTLCIALGLLLFWLLGFNTTYAPCTVGIALASPPALPLPHRDMPWTPRPDRRWARMTCAVPCNDTQAWASRREAMAAGLRLATWQLFIAADTRPWVVSASRTSATIANVAGRITVRARQLRDTRGRFTATWAYELSDMNLWQPACHVAQ